MSIPYRLTPVKDNISNNPKKGYYAQVVTRGTIDTEDLCDEISASCTLTSADLKAAIEALTSSVSTKLKAGYNVCIDDLGTFSISAESEMVDSPDDIHAQSVRVKNVHFRPSVRLKKAMKVTHFERVVQKINKK